MHHSAVAATSLIDTDCLSGSKSRIVRLFRCMCLHFRTRFRSRMAFDLDIWHDGSIYVIFVDQGHKFNIIEGKCC